MWKKYTWALSGMAILTAVFLLTGATMPSSTVQIHAKRNQYLNLITPSDTFLSLGTAGCTSNRGMGVNDICITNDVEFNGTTYIDQQMQWNATTKVNDGVGFGWGTGGDVLFLFQTNQTPDTMMIDLGAEGNTLIIGEDGSRSTDHGIAQQADATLVVQGNSADTDDHIMITHNATRAVVNSGEGGVHLQGGAGVTALIAETRIETTVPAEPFACASGTIGTIVYVDDDDDAGAAAWCTCIASGDDGAGAPNAWDWRRLDANGTACPFF